MIAAARRSDSTNVADVAPRETEEALRELAEIALHLDRAIDVGVAEAKARIREQAEARPPVAEPNHQIL